MIKNFYPLKDITEPVKRQAAVYKRVATHIIDKCVISGLA